MPCQVGECSSRAPRNVPPASTPESTPPQNSGGVRASPSDPQKRAAKYRSAGWKKDLEHVLKTYYRHMVASFKEAEWAKMKERNSSPTSSHQGGGVGHQRKLPHGIHALYGRPVLCGHGPQTQWVKGLHRMDKTRQLLPWIGG